MGQKEITGACKASDVGLDACPKINIVADDQSAMMKSLVATLEKMEASLAEIKSMLTTNQQPGREVTPEDNPIYVGVGRPGKMLGPDTCRNLPQERSQATYGLSYGRRPGPGPSLRFPDQKIQLERYSGTSTKTLPANWMRNYERMAFLKDWPEEHKASMFPFYLADEASTWYDNHVSQESMAWTEVRDRFISFFNQDKIVTPKMVATKEWDPKAATFYEHFKEMMQLFEFSGTPQSWRTQLLQTSLPPYYGRMCSGVEEVDTELWYKRAAKIICNLPTYEGKPFFKAKDPRAVVAGVV